MRAHLSKVDDFSELERKRTIIHKIRKSQFQISKFYNVKIRLWAITNIEVKWNGEEKLFNQLE